LEKLKSLIAAISAANPEFARDPARLESFVDKGRVVSRRTATLGFEYRYRCSLFVEDHARSVDAIMVPLLIWLRTNQPELFLNFDREDQAIQFTADILDNGNLDLFINFELTEAVSVVPNGDGRWQVTHLPEPDIDDLLLEGAVEGINLAQLWLGDDKLLPDDLPRELPDA